MPATTTHDQSVQPAQNHRTGKSEVIALTAEGRGMLEARVVRLNDEQIPALEAQLGDPDRPPETDAAYERALTELKDLTEVLEHAVGIDEAPEQPGIVELGDDVMVEFDDGTERFLLVHPVESLLDDVRVSVEAPFAQALMGRRVGEDVEVDAPAGSYRIRIVASSRHRAA